MTKKPRKRLTPKGIKELNSKIESVENAIKPNSTPGYETRVGRGEQTLPKIDQRSWEGRRVNEVYHGIIDDLGGSNYVTQLQQALAKQAASMITIGEDMAAQRILGSEHYDFLQHQNLVRTLTTVSRSIGITRVAKDPQELDLQDYVEVPDED